MSNVSLDRLKRLSPRDAWSNEATDFTPWLARDENFEVLAEALHFTDAEVQGTEQSVGTFSADIIAQDRDGYILIENQLEQTDHTHLGQILTYLAGLDGVLKVVWVSTKVREEHRAAVDWLNAHTPDDFSFFAVELELFQIGTSPLAPHFHVVAKPNTWSRHVSSRARKLSETQMNDRQVLYHRFWTSFSEYMEQQKTGFGNRKPPKGHWWSLGIGRSGFNITLTANGRDSLLGAEIWIGNDSDKLIFDHFHADRELFDNRFGEPLIWERLDNGKGSRIVTRQNGVDIFDETKWEQYFAWYSQKMDTLKDCFAEPIRDLDLSALNEVKTQEEKTDE